LNIQEAMKTDEQIIDYVVARVLLWMLPRQINGLVFTTRKEISETFERRGEWLDILFWTLRRSGMVIVRKQKRGVILNNVSGMTEAEIYAACRAEEQRVTILNALMVS